MANEKIQALLENNHSLKKGLDEITKSLADLMSNETLMQLPTAEIFSCTVGITLSLELAAKMDSLHRHFMNHGNAELGFHYENESLKARIETRKYLLELHTALVRRAASLGAPHG